MLRAAVHHAVVALGLFVLWVILSGMLDAFHLGLGAASAIGVSLLSARRLYTEVDTGGRQKRHWLSYLRWHRIAWYFVVLLRDIAVSNLAVARRVVGPVSALKPSVFHLRPPYRSELARVALGNSIILTPGTTVLDVTADGHLVVHALDVDLARGTAEGDLQSRVGWAFEPPES